MAVSREARISMMLTMTSLFFIVEIVMGYVTSSLVLVADAFHMLSDVMSMAVALYAIQLAKIQGNIPTNTYGWQRAEVLGALINGVFLLALCFTIMLDAITRLIKPEGTFRTWYPLLTHVAVEKPVVLLWTGGVGLLINIVGLFLFHGMDICSRNLC